MKALHDLGRRTHNYASTDTITAADIRRVADQMRNAPMPAYQREFLTTNYWAGWDLAAGADQTVTLRSVGRTLMMDFDRTIHHQEMAFGHRRIGDRIALHATREEWREIIRSIPRELWRDYLGEEGTAPPTYRGYPVLVT